MKYESITMIDHANFMTWMTPLRFIAIACFGLLLPSHRSAQAAPSRVQRDSASVRVVSYDSDAVNRVPIVNAELIWSANRIGQALAADEIVAARQLSDGQVVLAFRDRVAHFHDPSAAVLVYGRRGDGPGEFTSGITDLMVLAGDTVVVHESAAQRITMFYNGGYVRTLRVPDGALRGAFTGGLLVFSAVARRPPASGATSREVPPALRAPDGRALFRFSAVSVAGDREPSKIVDQAGPDVAPITAAEARRSGLQRTNLVTEAPFSRVLGAAVSGDLLFTGDGGKFVLEGRRRTGELASIVQFAVPPVSISAGARRQWVTDRLSRASVSDRPIAAALLRDVSPATNYFPYYDLILSDRDNRLWVRRYVEPGDSECEWYVIDANGVLVTRVNLSTATLPLDASGSSLLVLNRSPVQTTLQRLHVALSRE